MLSHFFSGEIVGVSSLQDKAENKAEILETAFSEESQTDYES